jgi:D-methionine transport system substrate-binding protein
MKKIIFLIYILFSVCLFSILTGCQDKTEAANVIKVGTVTGPDEQVLDVAKEVAKKQFGLDMQLVTFSDYTLPNAALSDGSIDANIFQHQPYLDAAIKANNYQLIAIGKTFIFPMGIYSKKYKNINQIPNKAIVAVPNDPSNEARALLLLAKAGLITLKPNANINATLMDIASNPKHLQIKELDAAQLPRTLSDVAIAVINSNYAIPAGLIPTKNAIYLEDTHSPYANIIVVRTADKDSAKLQDLVKIMHSPEVVSAAEKIFSNQAIPAWK